MRNLVCSVLVSLSLAACGDDSSVPAGSGGSDASTGSTGAVAASGSTSTTTSTASSGGQGGNVTGGGEGGGGAGGSGDGGGGTSVGGSGGGTGLGGSGGSGDGGSGVGGAGDGGAGVGGSGVGGQGAGGSTTSGGPLDCAVCVATGCPEIAECIGDPVCADGLVCTLTGCIVDGQPDLLCIAECFDGDFTAALGALEALGCIVSTCGSDCGGLIPAG